MASQSITTLVTGGPLDLCIAGWLDEKFQHTQSTRTQQEYRATLARFRGTLAQIGLELDGDPVAVALVAQRFASFSMRGKQVSPATVNTRLACLSSFYEYARKRKAMQENPIETVARSKVQAYAKARALHPLLVAERLHTIDRTSPIGMRDYALLVVFLQTGRRLSEVARLTWKDVEIQGEQVTLIFLCKGHKVLSDTLPTSVGNALLAWLTQAYGDLRTIKREASLWPNFARNGHAGAPLGRQGIADVCKKYLGTSKVHTLRHTFSANMLRVGAGVQELQARLGHEHLNTTGVYVPALQAAQNKYAEDLAALLGIGQ